MQAQAQVDQLAGALSSALSDKTTDGTAIAGVPAGFALDLAGVQNGNVVHFSYTDTATNKVHNVSIVRVDDPTALPLTNAATINPNDEVIGINFSGGTGSVAAQLNAAFSGKNIQFTNPSGSTLQVLDDGGPDARSSECGTKHGRRYRDADVAPITMMPERSSMMIFAPKSGSTCNCSISVRRATTLPLYSGGMLN